MPQLDALCRTYLAEIRNQRSQSNTTDELSYRDYLSNLFRGATEALQKEAHFTGEARRQVYGRPDYVVTKGLKQIGSIEAESLGANLSDLRGHAKEQNDRFKQNIHNFLLTNHLEFRLFVDGREVASARLPNPPEHGATSLTSSAVDEFGALLDRFLSESSPAAVSPAQIADQLAKRARILRVAADAMLSHDDSPLHPFWNAYKQTLYSDLSAERFADVYAQTFTYGLFLAWLSTNRSPFDRETALRAIPDAVPPIRVLLEFGGGRRLPEEFAWIIDGICSDLDSADKEGILKPFGESGDPMVYFYETFLAAYDPKQRERVGVYYTPDAVVDFIVRAIDDILKRDFNLREGLADKDVILLDPATGTGTFLAHAYRRVRQTLQERGEAGLWPDRARNHLAAHFNGFELLPAAYTLAHVKLRNLLAEMGVPLPDTTRLPVYLTNTLEEGVRQHERLPFTVTLVQEAEEAAHVKNDKTILVVLGNPPYSGHSANPSRDSHGELTWIGRMIEDYRAVDGEPLGERNPKWLQDDYVKFLRFAQWRIQRTGHGVIGMITNHGYLDNPTFRGMRWHLMQSFDEVYVLDLHGNSKKKERSPDGSEDKNVFDIQQGVAICLLIKHPNAASGNRTPAVVRQAELFGAREKKYEALYESSFESVDWQELAPSAPFYLFKPQDEALRAEYEAGWKATEIFPIGVLGFQTHRDHLAIDFEEGTLQKRIEDLRNPALSDSELIKKYQLQNWDIASARSSLVDLSNWREKIIRCSYRPFDDRYCFYAQPVVDRPRPELQRNIVGRENIALNTVRQTRADTWCHVMVSRKTSPAVFVEIKDGSSVFPLYLFAEAGTLELDTERRPNMSHEFLGALRAKIGTEPRPEEIFNYIYAILSAPSYRSLYAEFLKTDFPRIPLPPDAETFNEAAQLGAKLVALHLLEAPSLNNTGIGFPIAGDHSVKKMRLADRYVPPANGSPGRVRLNDTEYFDNVPPEAWEFRVGGYQPAFKWLDDRAARLLSEDEINHYRKALAAMRDTVALLPAIDQAFLRILGRESDDHDNEASSLD